MEFVHSFIQEGPKIVVTQFDNDEGFTLSMQFVHNSQGWNSDPSE
jgi:hypothetical protein